MEKTDWKNLPFAYLKTDYNVRCYFKNGEWGDILVSDSEFIELHIASTCLHYGQEIFEGLKAYKGKDGRVRLFRWEENSKRMIHSAQGVMMAEVPSQLFKKSVFMAVKMNERFIPPYGFGATLYIRPLLLGLGPEVGVKAAKEYLFMVFVTPVGPYFKDGFAPVDIMICRSYDRAAPLGTGSYKVGGNYAASLLSLKDAHNAGFSTTLYLDAREKKYIDEAGPANFFGIKGNTYVTPDSKSILPSITNISLMQLAEDIGMKVERRPVPIEELPEFDEAGACGTAAVITPIRKIVDPDMNKIYQYCEGNIPGPICTKLYNRLTSIQSGDEEDKFQWISFVD
jgi:branched-chain amino acid aminotransferase